MLIEGVPFQSDLILVVVQLGNASRLKLLGGGVLNHCTLTDC